jgi:YEATS domain-containing protein 4
MSVEATPAQRAAPAPTPAPVRPAPAVARAPDGHPQLNGAVEKRKVGISVCCPIVFGSIAFWLGRKADGLHTHKWTLYVRGPNGEDVSYFVSKVVFTLHASFAQPIREIISWPFEVTEMGWGEFEAKMTVHFKDPAEKPIDVVHPLRLYPDGNTTVTTKRPVVYEKYDEVVFTDPTASFFDQLMEGQQATPRPHEHTAFYSQTSDADDLHKLMAARMYVLEQLQDARDRILRLEGQVTRRTVPHTHQVLAVSSSQTST